MILIAPSEEDRDLIAEPETVSTPSSSGTRWFWLMFLDNSKPYGERWFASALVRTNNVDEAVTRIGATAPLVTALVAAGEFTPQPGWSDRLLNRQEAEEFDRLHPQARSLWRAP